MLRLLALSLLVFTSAAAPSALAQDRVNLDEDDSSRRTAKKSARAVDAEVAREIERGVFLKTNVGTTIFLGNRSQLLRAGTTMMLTVGQDVVDKPKTSVAWELTFMQSIHNGAFGDYSQIAGLGPNQLIQGDSHVLAGMVGVEAQGYPVRRLGLGGHLGGGVGFVPLLMNRQYYDEDVIPDWGGVGVTPPVHQGAKAVAYGGLNLEYYTKLSHFSMGLAVDGIWIMDLDFGLTVTGMFKYSF